MKDLVFFFGFAWQKLTTVIYSSIVVKFKQTKYVNYTDIIRVLQVISLNIIEAFVCSTYWCR